MKSLETLAEQRIVEAIARGELDDLPGAGRAVELDDDSMVPESLRMAYRVLRNAGMVPEEVRLRADVGRLLQRSLSAPDTVGRERAARRLSVLLARLEASGGVCTATLAEYRAQILQRLQGA